MKKIIKHIAYTVTLCLTCELAFAAGGNEQPIIDKYAFIRSSNPQMQLTDAQCERIQQEFFTTNDEDIESFEEEENSENEETKLEETEEEIEFRNRITELNSSLGDYAAGLYRYLSNPPYSKLFLTIILSGTGLLYFGIGPSGQLCVKVMMMKMEMTMNIPMSDLSL